MLITSVRRIFDTMFGRIPMTQWARGSGAHGEHRIVTLYRYIGYGSEGATDGA